MGARLLKYHTNNFLLSFRKFKTADGPAMLIPYIFPDSIPMCKEVKWLLKRGVFSFYILRI